MSIKRAYALDSQTNRRFCVIRKNKALDIRAIKTWLNDNMKWYALIVHSQDIDPVTKETIPVHYHFVGESSNNRRRLLQDMNDFADYMGIDTNGLQWDGYKSQTLALQYLIHKNNPEKTQHEAKEVILAGMSEEEYLTLLTCDSEQTINFDLVFTLCERCNNVVELLREIPPNMFKANYQYIRTLWNAIHNGQLNQL